MGAALFAPDLFSRPSPVFQPAEENALREIKEILERHYLFASDEILSAGKLSGIEVNSNNYKIIASSGVFALKCAGLQTKSDVLDVQLRVSQKLLEKGVAVPCVVKTQDGLYSVGDENGKIWILSKFVEGGYFSGSSHEMLKLFQSVNDLQESLESLDEASALPLSAAACGWPETKAILEELLSRRPEWDCFFPASESAALAREEGCLRRVFDKLSIFHDEPRGKVVPTHIDLHPHNVLIDGQGKPVIVDIDSLQRADKIQSLSFAAFKLVRQHIIHEKPADTGSPARKLMDILEIDMNVEKFGCYAAAEVMRRIGIIADMNMHKENRQWNKVLHMQLAALHEIPHIFKAER